MVGAGWVQADGMDEAGLHPARGYSMVSDPKTLPMLTRSSTE